MTESQNPQGAIPLDAIKTAGEVITPSLSDQTPIESRVPGVPTAEHEESPESAKKTAGVFIRDIVIAGWRTDEITDPIISQKAQDTINALASLDQMDQEITDPNHPDKKTPNPLYRPGANYDAVTGKYVCIGPDGVKIEGVAGLQTSIATLRTIADTESVDQVKRASARQLAETLEKQLSLQQSQTPEAAIPPIEPKETISGEDQESFFTGCGIKPENREAFDSLWQKFQAGKLSGSELVGGIKNLSESKMSLEEFNKKLEAARTLYRKAFGKDAPVVINNNPDALIKVVVDTLAESLYDPKIRDKIINNLGGTLDVLRKAGTGQNILQILMVLGSLMSSFASTAEEAAK